MSGAEIVYEVNVELDEGQRELFWEWLPGHADELLALDGFVSATGWAVESDDNDGRARFCVHYRLTSREALEVYFREHAERLRGDGVVTFGDSLRATRRVMAQRLHRG